MIKHATLVLAKQYHHSIVLLATGWKEAPESECSQQNLRHWLEFAQFGHRCYDLGQMLGDLHEPKVHKTIDNSMSVMGGAIERFGEPSDEMAAMHVDVYLINRHSMRLQPRS